MEDPSYPIMNGQLGPLDGTLDPTYLTTYPYPQQALTYDQPNSVSSMMHPNNTYSQSDGYSQSYLSNVPAFNPNENLFDSLPGSSHSDLNHFFNDSAFDGETPDGLLTSGSRFGVEKSSHDAPTLGPSWLRQVQQAAPDWDSQQSQNGSLAVDTDVQDNEQRETVVKNGQVTPGDSPSSPKSQKGARKSSRKSKPVAKLEGEASESVASAEQAAPPAPAKRARKPRRSNKKKPTPEEEAAKREMFLKRNREAAYKCRIKKKNQTEDIVERAKMLDADNALKGLEVERLRREIESLRAMLLPHWRGCGDENLSGYVDNLVKGGWGLGKMVLASVAPRPRFEVEDEPRVDDGRNDDLTHPRTEDEENGDPEMAERAHKRRRSSNVYEMSLGDFEESMRQQTAYRQRRESFFGSSLAPGDLLQDGTGTVGRNSLSSSGSDTPAMRATLTDTKLGMDILSEEFLVGDTPPPLDLSAPDGDSN